MRVLIALGGAVAVVLGLALAVLVAWPLPAPAAIGVVDGDPKRGAYLARLSGCISCHTAAGGKPLSGGPPLHSPFGTFFAPNITPHPDAGIGAWTFEQFVRAVRQGVSPSGAPYYPAFPYEFYATLTDRDMADIWAALKVVPAVPAASPQHAVGFPFNVREGLKVWKSLFEQRAVYAPRAEKSKAWNRGRYIVEGPAHCGACHTPRNLAGGLTQEAILAGDPTMMDGGESPSITAEALRDRGFTKETLVDALRSGVLPDGDVLGGSMVEVVGGSTGFLLTEHLSDIATYLLDLE